MVAVQVQLDIRQQSRAQKLISANHRGQLWQNLGTQPFIYHFSYKGRFGRTISILFKYSFLQNYETIMIFSMSISAKVFSLDQKVGIVVEF